MATNRHYSTLIKVLDQLCSQAPHNFKSYHPCDNDIKGLGIARSKALIHLFLKVKFGLTRFSERHDWITDETQDGGIDAYYLDSEHKELILIQSKLRHTVDGFHHRSISADDLVKMEIERILKGEKKDSRGTEFNDKIQRLQERWRNVPDPASYLTTVIIIGDLKNYSDEQIKRLLDNNIYEVFDHERIYKDLVFPLCAGTFFDPEQIEITIEIQEDIASTLRRKIDTEYGSFQVRVLFVPASEIGRILSKYKNSILKYNPRNYLALARNKVNKQIRLAIINSQTNEFALFNNGITLIANSCYITERTGNIEKGQVMLKKPQIINGGQTAYTLSKIYEEGGSMGDKLLGKEVMLRVIIVTQEEVNKSFIDNISSATNQQTRVEEADRRSNDPVQLYLQHNFYSDFGLFYERKRGEFYHGLDEEYIDKDFVIDRYEMLRAYLAFKGEPRWARQRGYEVLFRESQFISIIGSGEKYKHMYYAYKIYKYLNVLLDNPEWGMGLRYGKTAIIAAVRYVFGEPNYSEEDIDVQITTSITSLRNRWKEFEIRARSKTENKRLYGKEDFDFDNYYKGATLDKDIKEYFTAA